MGLKERKNSDGKTVMMEKGHRREYLKAEEVLTEEERKKRDSYSKGDARRKLAPRKKPHYLLDVDESRRRPMRPSRFHPWEECISSLDRPKLWEDDFGYLPEWDEWFFFPETLMTNVDLRHYIHQHPFKGFGIYAAKSGLVRFPIRVSEMWKSIGNRGLGNQARQYRDFRRSEIWRNIYSGNGKRVRDLAADLAVLDVYMLFGMHEGDPKAIEKVRQGKYVNPHKRTAREACYQIASTMKQIERAFRQSHELNHRVLITEMFPEEMVWAIKNMHLIEDPVRPETWRIGPSKAPSDLHWNLLMIAAMEPQLMAATISRLMNLYHRMRTKAEWRMRLAEINNLMKESRKNMETINKIEESVLNYLRAESKEKNARARSMESQTKKAIELARRIEEEKLEMLSVKREDEDRRIQELDEIWVDD